MNNDHVHPVFRGVINDMAEIFGNSQVKKPVKILTYYCYPPIPIRKFDWMAVTDAYDEGDPIGWGETKEEAIASLKSLLAEQPSTT